MMVENVRKNYYGVVIGCGWFESGVRGEVGDFLEGSFLSSLNLEFTWWSNFSKRFEEEGRGVVNEWNVPKWYLNEIQSIGIQNEKEKIQNFGAKKRFQLVFNLSNRC